MKNPYFSEQNARQLALTFKSLTMQNSMEFKKELLEYIDSCNRPIYIDASFLSEIDSSGLAVLIQAKQKAKEKGIDLSVVNLRGRPKHVAEISKVFGVLTENYPR